MNKCYAGNPTILVAEDDEGTQILLTRAFKKAGSRSQLRFVNDGREAMCYLQGSQQFNNREEFPLPHLVLLEIKMPGMDGFEVLRRIRRERTTQEMIVVMFSSSDEQSDIARAFAGGANSY